MKTYGSEPGIPETDPVRVGVSEFAIGDGGQRLQSHGLGSCVAIALWDPTTGTGGLAHVMLPSADGDDDSHRPAKFADTAVRTMLREMVDRGADYTAIEAKIAGGSEPFSFDGFDDRGGRETVAAARTELDRLDVAVVGEDVGGDAGRTVELDTTDGTLAVHTAGSDDPTEI